MLHILNEEFNAQLLSDSFEILWIKNILVQWLVMRTANCKVDSSSLAPANDDPLVEHHWHFAKGKGCFEPVRTLCEGSISSCSVPIATTFRDLPFKSGYSGYGSVPEFFFDLPGKIWEFKKFKFKKIKCMLILGNSQWEGSFPVGRELPGGDWEESFPVRRELPSGKGSS